VDPTEFIERYPRLWHMAELGSWASIQAHGLLSTSALLDLFEIKGEQRIALEEEHRPQSVTIEHTVHGIAVIRDQKPLSESILARRLNDDLQPSDWYKLLNKRVFFWVNEDRLERMLGAGAYRDRQHTVLEVDTIPLVSRHQERISLSPINSGATYYLDKRMRGLDTFRRFPDYPWAERLRMSRTEPVVELAVDYAVADAADFVIGVTTRRAR
jgi:hypothetical protein